jgi:hypothetical protein
VNLNTNKHILRQIILIYGEQYDYSSLTEETKKTQEIMITQILYTDHTHLVLINNIHSKTTDYSPVLSAPRGIITSAYFFVYNQNKIKLELEKSQ